MSRWLVVTPPPGKTILGGAYLWDGQTAWQPPDGGGRDAADMVASGELLEEAQALADGYTWPPPPPQPWVAVDHGARTIVGGPWDWNGEGDPPAAGDLMLEWDAVAGGYTWA